MPGVVMTPLNGWPASSPETVAALAGRTLIGLNGLAEDFAGAAVFLTGPASACITGQWLLIDGGLSVH
ncbi:SDR family oxidoreductase [Streptomyces sp. NPDC058735]|uniref:SDR family oxidoreductase n=1 Tax=unclassified Streptomyces TaxID=2593676 RepID=UPI0036744C0A